MEQLFIEYLERFATLHQDFKKAIAGLSTEALDYVPGAEMNSLCVNIVHICGATRYWIGDVALQDPSDRDRDAEFRAQGCTEAQLIDLLDHTEAYLHTAFEKLTLADLPEQRASVRHPNRTFTVAWALMHALEHLGIHVGHSQITRQLWDQRGSHA